MWIIGWPGRWSFDDSGPLSSPPVDKQPWPHVLTAGLWHYLCKLKDSPVISLPYKPISRSVSQMEPLQCPWDLCSLLLFPSAATLNQSLLPSYTQRLFCGLHSPPCFPSIHPTQGIQILCPKHGLPCATYQRWIFQDTKCLHPCLFWDFRILCFHFNPASFSICLIKMNGHEAELPLSKFSLLDLMCPKRT